MSVEQSFSKKNVKPYVNKRKEATPRFGTLPKEPHHGRGGQRTRLPLRRPPENERAELGFRARERLLSLTGTGRLAW